MKIASIQFDNIWEDKEANLKRVAGFVQQAQRDNCDLIIFPEMFNSGFSMNAAKISETSNGQTSHILSNLARQYQINIIAGLTEKHEGDFCNIALVINREGSIIAKYIKNYPFTNAGENQFYKSGNQQTIFDIDGIKSSVFICYDLRFPELFRKVAADVEMIVVIANWPETRQTHWISLLKARAIENQCFIIGVNRTGTDGNALKYCGGSQVFDPNGVNVSDANANQEYIASVIDVTQVAQIRKLLPFLKDIK